MKEKVLVIRYSSIGDLVLCSPVYRVLFNAGYQVHLATKEKFEPVVNGLETLTKVHTLSNSLANHIEELREERFSFIIDLHNNLRTRLVKSVLGLPNSSFNKLNVAKWLAVRGNIAQLPKIHIVERYLNTLKPFGFETSTVKPNLEFPLQEPSFKIDLPEFFVAIAIGAQHNTKRITPKGLASIINNSTWPIVILGAEKDKELLHDALKSVNQSRLNSLIDFCGRLDLNGSAWVISKAQGLITHDTGLMHIGAALQKSIVVIWGNTIPEFGMYPWQVPFINLQVQGLNCRPCSKIGFNNCPKSHFNCMEMQDFSIEKMKALNLFFTQAIPVD